MFHEDARLEKMRGEAMGTIRLMRIILYLATAAAFAAAAADFAGKAVASAVGNIGLLLIMARLFIMTPVTVARARKGEKRWIEAEYEHIAEHYPWADGMGRVGWIVLGVSVLMQIFLGAA